MSLRNKYDLSKPQGFPEKGLNRLIITKLEVDTAFEGETCRLKIYYKVQPDGFEMNQSLGGKFIKNSDGKITGGSIFDIDDLLDMLSIKEGLNEDGTLNKGIVESFRNPKLIPSVWGMCYESGKVGSTTLYWGIHRRFCALDAKDSDLSSLEKDFYGWQAYMEKNGFRIFELKATKEEPLSIESDDDIPF